MDISTDKIITSPQIREKKQAYLEGLLDAQQLLRQAENMVDLNNKFKKKIEDERRSLRRL